MLSGSDHSPFLQLISLDQSAIVSNGLTIATIDNWAEKCERLWQAIPKTKLKFGMLYTYHDMTGWKICYTSG